MATKVLTNVGIWQGAYALRGDFNAVSVDAGSEMQDDTVFGDDTRSNKPGLDTLSYSGDGFWSGGDEEVDDVLFSAIGSARALHTLSATDSEGDVCYFFQAVRGAYNPGASVGELLAFQVEGAGAGSAVVRGTLMQNGIESATGNGTARQVGAVASTEKLYAGLHVVAASGTTPTLDVKVQSDDASGFPSPTDRITFTQATAITSEWATPVDGAITDDWWRVSWTIGGTSPSFTFIVPIGIR